MTEKIYKKRKNEIMNEILKVAKDLNKKVFIHNNILKMMHITIKDKSCQKIHIHIKSYKQYLLNINEHNIVISYMDNIFQYWLFCVINVKKVINNLIKEYNNSFVECNICLEKKILSFSCQTCIFECCSQCKKKLMKNCIDEDKIYKCPLCRKDLV